MERLRRHPLAPSLWLIALLFASTSALAQEGTHGEEGKRLYRAACAACHGADGRGAPKALVGFEEALPDFTDCRFANREPDADWLGVSHEGGPTRGFSTIMPAFGGALSQEEQLLILDHIRSLCTDDRWPRGELNLPRPLVTEKAYPEDELVVESGASAEGEGDVTAAIVYEKRFGPRNQLEVKVPFRRRERGTGDDPSDWESGLGDMSLGLKRALYHSYERGSIFSATAEVVLPTGDQDEGLGKGYTVFEPFLTFGQLLPADTFLQFQGGMEIPVDQSDADEEAFLRGVVGKTWSATQFGRAWTPMVEILAFRELASGESVHWDAVPQVQVSLNTRQHVLANIGVRVPLDDRDDRDAEILVYILWDWFDGGFFQGW